MRKILIVGFLSLIAFSSCQQDDEALPAGARPDERLNAALTDYKSKLVDAAYGWKGVLYTGAGGAYSFYFKFSENDRVTMYSDIDATTASVPMESTYRLKAMQRPSLLFDTYSYIHLLSDPDPSKNGGIVGAGMISDFQFAFDSVADNSISLVGSFNESRLFLEEATQEEAQNFIPEVAAVALAFENINNFKTYFKRLTLGENEVDLMVNTKYREISFSYFTGTGLASFTTNYHYSTEGLVLNDPYVLNGVTISNLTELQYNAQNSVITFTENGAPGIIASVGQPIAIDLNAARRFYGNPANGLYWVSDNGFTIEGEPDALGVAAMESFAFSTFWPQFDQSEGTTYDLFGFIIEDAGGLVISSGPAFVPEFTNDGRLILHFLGTLGEILPEDEAVFWATTEILADPEGFYAIQTSEQSYDLVSADGATKWISFVPFI